MTDALRDAVDWLQNDALDWVVTSGIIPLVVAVVVGAALWLAIALALRIRQATLRKEFRETYALPSLPRAVVVHVRREEAAVGSITLVFPRWSFARKDGRADLRHGLNPIMHGRSALRVGRFEVVADDPIELYDLARSVRRAGATIALTPAERRKYELLRGRRAEHAGAASIDAIIARFVDRPTDFERFCADRFRERGFQVTQTPPSRDGGFDLVLERTGLRWLVECKCFARHNKVGRPHLQKLVGANSVERADRLVFVTTSAFTPAAIEYAQQAGIELIDGPTLARMGRSAAARNSVAHDLAVADVELSRQELLQFYPADMRA